MPFNTPKEVNNVSFSTKALLREHCMEESRRKKEERASEARKSKIEEETERRKK